MLSLIVLIYLIMTAARWSKNHLCSQIIEGETEMLAVKGAAWVHAVDMSQCQDSRVLGRSGACSLGRGRRGCRFSPRMQCFTSLARVWAAWEQGYGSLLLVLPLSSTLCSDLSLVNAGWGPKMLYGDFKEKLGIPSGFRGTVREG